MCDEAPYTTRMTSTSTTGSKQHFTIYCISAMACSSYEDVHFGI